MSGIQTVLLVVYLLIVLSLIGVILLQRSEGGGLGMGGNAGGLMTVRGSANLLTRTTAILAALFFATAIGLTILSELDRGPTQGILDAAGTGTDSSSAPTNVLDALSQLQGDNSAPAATSAQASAAAPADPGLALPLTSAPASSSTAPAAAASAAPSAAPVASVEPAASSAPAAASASASSGPSQPPASAASSASAQ